MADPVVRISILHPSPLCIDYTPPVSHSTDWALKTEGKHVCKPDTVGYAVMSDVYLYMWICHFGTFQTGVSVGLTAPGAGVMELCVRDFLHIHV